MPLDPLAMDRSAFSHSLSHEGRAMLLSDKMEDEVAIPFVMVDE